MVSPVIISPLPHEAADSGVMRIILDGELVTGTLLNGTEIAATMDQMLPHFGKPFADFATALKATTNDRSSKNAQRKI